MKYEDVLSGKKHTSQTSNYPIGVGKTIEEPNTELNFSIEDSDVVGSVVADKESCAAAKALCKLPGVEHAWVFRTVTLIKREDGTIERYKNPGTLKKAVEKFDESAGLFPSGEYVLKPLGVSQRAAYKKKWNDAHPKRHASVRPYKYELPPKKLRNK